MVYDNTINGCTVSVFAGFNCVEVNDPQGVNIFHESLNTNRALCLAEKAAQNWEPKPVEYTGDPMMWPSGEYRHGPYRIFVVAGTSATWVSKDVVETALKTYSTWEKVSS